MFCDSCILSKHIPKMVNKVVLKYQKMLFLKQILNMQTKTIRICKQNIQNNGWYTLAIFIRWFKQLVFDEGLFQNLINITGFIRLNNQWVKILRYFA